MPDLEIGAGEQCILKESLCTGKKWCHNGHIPLVLEVRGGMMVEQVRASMHTYLRLMDDPIRNVQSLLHP